MIPSGGGITFHGTMRCGTCGKPVSSPSLACVDCLKKTTVRHYLALQGSYMPYVQSGKFRFRLARGEAGGTVYHLELFGVASLAYCGADICLKCKRVEAKFEEVLETVLCPACRKALETVLIQIPLEAA